MRFRPFYVFSGFTVAFMLKMFVAVLFGQVIAKLPASLVVATSTATFFITALVIWFKKEDAGAVQHQDDNHFSRAALITFTAISLSEWGDIGQITAATLTARYQVPLVIWLGATLALMTKGLLALTLGFGLRKHIPQRILRPISAGLCLIMGIVSAIEPMLQ
jgi:putative Ca2+/H+ antiporter (TMEM165/GDT1 family)